MFKVSDLIVHYRFGYFGVITDVIDHDKFPYVVHYISKPHEDDDDFYPIEHCSEGEIKLLDNLNEIG